MKTIVLFGATGNTGRIFLKKALDKGYQVKALVRTPSKLDIAHPSLTVVKGDILDQEAVNHIIAGSDAVVNLAGHVKGSPDNLQTQATEYIISAMKSHGVKRLISLTGGGVRDPKNDDPKFMDKMIVFIMKYSRQRCTRCADGWKSTC